MCFFIGGCTDKTLGRQAILREAAGLCGNEGGKIHPLSCLVTLSKAEDQPTARLWFLTNGGRQLSHLLLKQFTQLKKKKKKKQSLW
jgi:hypothetical protein